MNTTVNDKSFSLANLSTRILVLTPPAADSQVDGYMGATISFTDEAAPLSRRHHTRDALIKNGTFAVITLGSILGSTVAMVLPAQAATVHLLRTGEDAAAPMVVDDAPAAPTVQVVDTTQPAAATTDTTTTTTATAAAPATATTVQQQSASPAAATQTPAQKAVVLKGAANKVAVPAIQAAPAVATVAATTDTTSAVTPAVATPGVVAQPGVVQADTKGADATKVKGQGGYGPGTTLYKGDQVYKSADGHTKVTLGAVSLSGNTNDQISTGPATGGTEAKINVSNTLTVKLVDVSYANQQKLSSGATVKETADANIAGVETAGVNGTWGEGNKPALTNTYGLTANVSGTVAVTQPFKNGNVQVTAQGNDSQSLLTGENGGQVKTSQTFNYGTKTKINDKTTFNENQQIKATETYGFGNLPDGLSPNVGGSGGGGGAQFGENSANGDGSAFGASNGSGNGQREGVGAGTGLFKSDPTTQLLNFNGGGSAAGGSGSHAGGGSTGAAGGTQSGSGSTGSGSGTTGSTGGSKGSGSGTTGSTGGSKGSGSGSTSKGAAGTTNNQLGFHATVVALSAEDIQKDVAGGKLTVGVELGASQDMVTGQTKLGAGGIADYQHPLGDAKSGISYDLQAKVTSVDTFGGGVASSKTTTATLQEGIKDGKWTFDATQQFQVASKPSFGFGANYQVNKSLSVGATIDTHHNVTAGLTFRW